MAIWPKRVQSITVATITASSAWATVFPSLCCRIHRALWLCLVRRLLPPLGSKTCDAVVLHARWLSISRSTVPEHYYRSSAPFFYTPRTMSAISPLPQEDCGLPGTKRQSLSWTTGPTNITLWGVYSVPEVVHLLPASKPLYQDSSAGIHGPGQCVWRELLSGYQRPVTSTLAENKCSPSTFRVSFTCCDVRGINWWAVLDAGLGKRCRYLGGGRAKHKRGPMIYCAQCMCTCLAMHATASLYALSIGGSAVLVVGIYVRQLACCD